MLDQDMSIITDMPIAAQEEVAYRSGYGCSRCGVTIYHYVSLPVEDSADWLAPSVTLLCPSCYTRLSATPSQTHQYKFYLDSPVAKDPNFNRRFLPYHSGLPLITAGGGALIKETLVPFMILGVAPIGFAPAPMEGAALSISLQLSDENGQLHKIIIANQWCAQDSHWTFKRTKIGYIIESIGGFSRAELEFPEPGKLIIRELYTMIDQRQVWLTPESLCLDQEKMVNAIESGKLVGLRL